MAKIIGEAAIRLRADSKTLKPEITRLVTQAIRDASADIRADTDGVTDGIPADADKTSQRVRSILGGLGQAGAGVASGLASVVTSGIRLTLIGAAAGVALAGVSSLVTGLFGLIGVMGQAAGVLGLLPAAMVAVKAVSATLTLALDGVGESFSALASGDAAAFQESLKGLAPSARAFVTEVAKVKPAFDALKLKLQQTAFEGLASSVAPLAQRYLPLLNTFFKDIGGTANAAAKDLLNFAANGETAGQVQLIAENIGHAFREFIPALRPAAAGLLDFVHVGSDFLPAIADDVAGLAQRFGEFMREAGGSGQLAAFFQNALDTVKTLGQALGNIGAGFANIFQAAQTAGGGFLNSLLEISQAFRSFTESASGQEALVGFFSAMRQVIAGVLPLFTTLAGVIGRDLAPILGNLAATLGPALQPVIAALGPALRAAAPGIQALAEGLAELLVAAAPLIQVAGELAGIIGGALGQVFKALAPVLQQVAAAISTGLAAIMPTLIPVLAQVASTLGQVFAALVPLIPAFFQILGAILPILPPLMQLVAALLPSLVRLVEALTPIITALAQVFAAVIPILTVVAETVLGILIPPIELIATIVGKVAAIVSNAFTAMGGIVQNIMSLMGSIISSIWQTIVGIFQRAVGSILDFVNNAFSRVRSFIGDAMGGIGRAVSDGIGNVVQWFRELPGKILGAIGNFARLLFDAGANLLSGLWEGIKSMISNLFNRVKEFASNLKNTIFRALGIASPSKVTREAGVYLMQGLVAGIQAGTADALHAADRVATAVTDAMALGSPYVDMASVRGGDGGALAAAGGAPLILQQTNNMLPGADVTQFSAEVWRRAAADLASGNSSLNVAQQPLQAGMAAPGSVVNLGV